MILITISYQRWWFYSHCVVVIPRQSWGASCQLERIAVLLSLCAVPLFPISLNIRERTISCKVSDFRAFCLDVPLYPWFPLISDEYLKSSEHDNDGATTPSRDATPTYRLGGEHGGQGNEPGKRSQNQWVIAVKGCSLL